MGFMPHVEKKYHVKSFDDILAYLDKIDAKKIKEVISIHYYGQRNDNDVEKFVQYPDRFEVHVFKEIDGTFKEILNQKIPNKQSGYDWLKNKGYTQINVVKMDYTEYAYKNGTVGFYIINKTLLSVILYYPPDDLAAIEKAFDLQNAEVIAVPYNKYLKRLGQLQAETI
jgi:hypothetical protein